MYDNLLRERLTDPDHYDRMIALIMLHNDSCTDEDWASDVINTCIRDASVYGDCAVGMCAAYEGDNGKISLYLEPIGEDGGISRLGKAVRKLALERSQAANRGGGE
jgi:hypothetical protein